MNKKCLHKRIIEGPRIPALYGSWATEICLQCNMWRSEVYTKNKWVKTKMPINKEGDEY